MTLDTVMGQFRYVCYDNKSSYLIFIFIHIKELILIWFSVYNFRLEVQCLPLFHPF